MKKFKLDRIISIATLVASLIAIILVLKKAFARGAAARLSRRLRNTPIRSITRWRNSSRPRSSRRRAYRPTKNPRPDKPVRRLQRREVHINSDEISAVLAQSLGNAGGAALTPDSNIGSAAPTIKDQQVSLDGDTVHGQFLTNCRQRRLGDGLRSSRREGWLCHVRSHGI